MSHLRVIDRRRALSLGLIVGSIAILTAGAIGILAALTGGGATLPDEGSIDEIVAGTTVQPTQGAPVDPGLPRGPAPIRFVIPTLYIDAPVIIETLDEHALPRVPGRPDQVAWYDFSASPGFANNAVFSGHVDWQTNDSIPIPGVFYRLREMKIGETIEVQLEDGATLQYRVTGNVATPYDDPNVVKVMNPTDRDVITIITCGGTWVNSRRAANGGNYSHRVIVRAERVLGLAGGDTRSAGG